MDDSEKNRMGSVKTPRIMLLLVVVEVLSSVLKSLLYSLIPEGKETLDLLYVGLSAVICLLMLVLPFVSLYKSAFLEFSEEEQKEKEEIVVVRKNVVKLVFCLAFLFLGALIFIAGIVLSDDIGPRANPLLVTGFFSVLVLSFLFHRLFPVKCGKEIKSSLYAVFVGGILVAMIAYNVLLVQHWPINDFHAFLVFVALLFVTLVHLCTVFDSHASEMLATHYRPLGKDLTALSYGTLLYWLLIYAPWFISSLDLLMYRDCPHYCEAMRACEDGSEESLRHKDLEWLKLQTFGTERYNSLADKESRSKEFVGEDTTAMVLYVNRMEKDGKEGLYVFGNIDDCTYGHMMYAPLSWYVKEYVLPNTHTYNVHPDEDELAVLMVEAERGADSLLEVFRRMPAAQRKALPRRDQQWMYLYLQVKLSEKSGIDSDMLSMEKEYALKSFVDDHMNSKISFRWNMGGWKSVTKATELYIITDVDGVKEALLACGVLEDNIHFVP